MFRCTPEKHIDNRIRALHLKSIDVIIQVRKDVDNMTDSEKLDLLLEKMTTVENEVAKLKRQVMKSTAELKAMDEMILDEVERHFRQA